MDKELAMHSHKGRGLVTRFADRFGVEPEKLLNTLKATAFKAGKDPVTNEQMMALLVVADQYGLNPWTKEIYAFPDKGGIVPVVGVDGWVRMMNEHPQFDGIEYDETPDQCTAVVYRKDRSHPIKVTEYMDECKRNTGPWGSHPRRMLRHKATIQAARLAFGFVGIYDQDEAERIVERDVTPVADEIVPPARPTIALEDIAPAPVQADSGPPSYAQIADMINNSMTEEESKAALDMSDGLPADQRAELAGLHVAKFKQVDMLGVDDE